MRGLTPDQVEQALREQEAIIAQARGRQMALLQLADEMQLPTADGCKSLREWVAGRADVSVETAYRLTSTASRLADLPELAQQLSSGAITFDRADATARIPMEYHDEWLLGFDIQGLRRIAARHRRMTRQGDHAAHAASHLAMQPNLDESRWSLWGELDGYSGSVVDKVLTEFADSIPPLPDGQRPGLDYRRAAALTALCEETRPVGSSVSLITVFVDEAGSEIAGGTIVGPEVLDRVACTGGLEVIGHTSDGRPLSLGRASRVIPGRLKRFVLHRDGKCTADGCTSRHRLEPHHKVPWSEGGPTDPENLTTLCWFHHHVVVHGWGYRIDDSLGLGRIRFTRPSGLDPP